MSQKGISSISVIVIAALMLALVAIFIFKFISKNQENRNYFVGERGNIENPVGSQSTDEPPLKLKSIGVNLDYFDSKTNQAGDFVFTKQKLQFNRLFMGFGFVIPGNMSSNNNDKANPQPTFILPLGTAVRSLVDGVVANIATVWSGDYSIQITTDGQLQKWVYETEHVIKPKVKLGDKVAAGQIIAEVSNFDKGAPIGFGTVEIGILKGGNPPSHVCPFLYLDESIKKEMQRKMIAFFKSWELYLGDDTLYDESTTIPGCLTVSSIEG